MRSICMYLSAKARHKKKEQVLYHMDIACVVRHEMSVGIDESFENTMAHWLPRIFWKGAHCLPRPVGSMS